MLVDREASPPRPRSRCPHGSLGEGKHRRRASRESGTTFFFVPEGNGKSRGNRKDEDNLITICERKVLEQMAPTGVFLIFLADLSLDPKKKDHRGARGPVRTDVAQITVATAGTEAVVAHHREGCRVWILSAVCCRTRHRLRIRALAEAGAATKVASPWMSRKGFHLASPC